MKNVILFIFTLLNFNTSFSQKQCKVIKALAFFTVIQPGTMPVDENGNPIKLPLNITRTIYLTTTCADKLEIKEIKYGNTLAKTAINRIDVNDIFLGQDLDGHKINMQTIKGNYLWKVDVVVDDTERLGNTKIYIKSFIQKKSFIIVMKKEIEIEGPLSN
jgi:hypothetical protein